MPDVLPAVQFGSRPADFNDPFDRRPICAPEQKTKLDQLLSRFFVGSISALPPDDIEASPMWSYSARQPRRQLHRIPV
jgi:hypothetical protein